MTPPPRRFAGTAQCAANNPISSQIFIQTYTDQIKLTIGMKNSSTYHSETSIMAHIRTALRMGTNASQGFCISS